MILIIDNGSQYTHLIKRNCRDLGFDREIIPNKKTLSEVKNLTKNAEKIILSGGPSSVTKGNNGLAEEILTKMIQKEESLPLLGICFGHQLIAHVFGGIVEKGKSAEYGLIKIEIDQEGVLFRGVPKEFSAWASHFDEVKKIPPSFTSLAHSELCEHEAMQHVKRPIFSVQFHPEVWHTEKGEQMLENFLKI